MGDRAVITTKENWKNNGVGVYLHWYGDREHVEAFLDYCRIKRFRPPEIDSYGWARFCQVVGNYIGGELSIGIDILPHLDCDNHNNGTYIINGWEVVGRRNFSGTEGWCDTHDLLLTIDESQPKHIRLGKKYIEADDIPGSELKAGDKIAILYPGVNQKGKLNIIWRKVMVLGCKRFVIDGENRIFLRGDATYRGYARNK